MFRVQDHSNSGAAFMQLFYVGYSLYCKSAVSLYIKNVISDISVDANIVHCVSEKNVTTLSCYNFDIHESNF